MEKSIGHSLLTALTVALVTAGIVSCQRADDLSSKAPVSQPAGSQSPLSVVKWGPNETRRGVAVNRQATGESAVWISLKGTATAGATVSFGSEASPAVIAPDLVTAVIPQKVIDTPGEYQVFVNEPSGRRTEVGVFRVGP